MRMTDQLGLITQLLEESREAQNKSNTMLAELRVELASLQRSNDGQAQSLSDMRAELRQIGDRVRDTELQMQRLPYAEAELARLGERIDGHHAHIEVRFSALDQRLRAIEGDTREHEVVTGALAGSARDAWRIIGAAIIGAIASAIAWAAKDGGLP